jgi:hypothetical protein
MKKRVSGLGIELYSGNAGAILSPVMLFFHQQVQLIKPVENSPVFLPVK